MFDLSRRAYYADFVTIPAFCLLLLAAHLGAAFSSAVVAGACVWTIAEYLIHRFVFHRVPYLRAEHDRHHARPSALIGASSILSDLLLLGIWLGARWVLGAELGNAAAIGFAGGYVGYIAVHDQFHHGHLQPGDVLYGAFRRHALHHRGLDANYGVTTPLWDWVFRTLADKPAQQER